MCENPTGFLAEKYKYVGHAHLKHFFFLQKKNVWKNKYFCLFRNSQNHK